MFVRIALAMVILAAAGQAVLAEDADKKAILGTWKIEKAVRGGEEMPAEERDKVTFEFKDGEVIVHEPGRDEPASYTLDAGKTPKRITIKPEKGDRQVVGIYELKGDSLKICFTRGEDGDVPTKFESAKDSRTMLLELKRAK